MLRKEDLYVYEEESYQRQINKEKVEIRRSQREVIFKRKRRNFSFDNYLYLHKDGSNDK